MNQAAEITLDISQDAVNQSLNKLGNSERGRRALKDMYLLWDKYGHGLDSENWHALSTICQAMNHYEQVTVAGLMRHAGKFKRPNT